jgi:hypothetical protein
MNRQLTSAGSISLSNSDLDKPLDATEPAKVSAVTSPNVEAMPVSLGTLGMFLLGNRNAILSLAACRETLWLGMILVFSAAFAREYDGEDLLHEPWHLLLPLVASLATSFILFGLISLIAWCRHAGLRGFWSRYRAFLGLYWMTAPLAWLYAIPVERFLSAGDATTANLNFLGCVSLWRVILITHILSVLLSARFWQVFFIVMWFADSVALALVSQIDVQILAVMGGVRLTEAERALAGAKLFVMFFGTLSWPIWCLVSLSLASNLWSPWKWGIPPVTDSRAIPRSVWSFAAASVVVWLVLLPWTQAEQQLRGTAERAFRAGRFSEMLAVMSAHGRDEFPPHWDPPPRIGASRERLRIMKVVSAFTPDTAPWVRALFCEKLSAALGRNDFPMETLWTETNVEELLTLIDELPESAEIVKGKTELLQGIVRFDGIEGRENSPRLSSLLLKSVIPPDEASQNSGSPIEEWRWNQYLQPLEAEKDRELVLKYHAVHLKRLLDNSKSAPQVVRDRIRRLLSIPSPDPAP